MKKVARQFDGVPGVVLHIGSLNTYYEGYGAWAREGKDHTPDDRAILRWMHTNKKNNLDGWYLAVHRGSGWQSDTAFPWTPADQFLEGEWPNKPSAEDLIEQYNPQIAVLEMGGFDTGLAASHWRPAKEFKETMAAILRGVIRNGTIPVLQTACPNSNRMRRVRINNRVLTELGDEFKLPLIDLYAYIFQLAPNDWDEANGVGIVEKGEHTLTQPESTRSGPATAENFKQNGQLLRTWLTVQKIKEIKRRVLDPIGKAKT